MYFLSDEERRYVLRKLLPASRASEVHPELRGWNWAESPLAPVYDAPLGVAEVAGRYCGTGRDLYLRRVVGVMVPPSALMLEGAALHRVAAGQVISAIKALYASPVDGALQALEGIRCLGEIGAGDGELPEAVRVKAAAVAEYQYHHIATRVVDVLARQPRVSQSGLVALALPAMVELPLDGRFLGLSGHLSVDAISLFEPMVLDLKFGPRRDFHRLGTAGYALVMESLYESPVNIGCVTYVEIEGTRVGLERDFHLIDDELRQWFLETRDQMMRTVSEEIDPGRPAQCDEGCVYAEHCVGQGVPGGRATGSTSTRRGA